MQFPRATSNRCGRGPTRISALVGSPLLALVLALVLALAPPCVPAAAQSNPTSVPDSLRLAPPLEELEERGQQVVDRRRRGALLFLGATAVAFVIIGIVRTRQRMARKRALASRERST